MAERSLQDRFRKVFEQNLPENLRFALEYMDEKVQSFLKRNPQIDEGGNFRFLIGSGYASGVLTGHRKDHNDLDIVRFDIDPQVGFSYRGLELTIEWRGTDALPGEMKLNPEFLKSTAIRLRPDGWDIDIYTVHPAVILAAKMADDTTVSESGDSNPRLRDIYDAVAILCSPYPKQMDWESVLETALSGLKSQNREASRRRITLLQKVIGNSGFETAFLAVADHWQEDLDPSGDTMNVVEDWL